MDALIGLAGGVTESCYRFSECIELGK